jgi:hypothetical protein
VVASFQKNQTVQRTNEQNSTVFHDSPSTAHRAGRVDPRKAATWSTPTRSAHNLHKSGSGKSCFAAQDLGGCSGLHKALALNIFERRSEAKMCQTAAKKGTAQPPQKKDKKISTCLRREKNRNRAISSQPSFSHTRSIRRATSPNRGEALTCGARQLFCVTNDLGRYSQKQVSKTECKRQKTKKENTSRKSLLW